ncbi:MAG TPA: hypothetical protein VLZ53_10945, partial [Devosia sp.]|nr:hypothetical protein [Devosia sp.]
GPGGDIEVGGGGGYRGCCQSCESNVQPDQFAISIIGGHWQWASDIVNKRRRSIVIRDVFGAIVRISRYLQRRCSVACSVSGAGPRFGHRLGRAEVRWPEVKRESAHKCIELLAGDGQRRYGSRHELQQISAQTSLQS